MGPPCRCSDCSPGTGHSVLDRRQRAVALCFVAAAWACAAAAQSVKGMAPGDQYFGRLKLSFLGINNTFKDSGIRAGAHTVDPDIQTKVDSAIDALNDWQRQFPNDPQLARSYFLAQQTLKKIWVKQYQEKAWAYMQHIVAQYPSTFYGKTIKAEIAKGFTQHYFATAEPCGPDGPQPLPTAAPAVVMGDPKHGAVIFKQNCTTCHGAAGAGGGIGPVLKGEKQRKNYAAAIVWIENPQPPMPKLYPSPLSLSDVQDVAAYVESL